jgi:hypothetical protein
MDGKGRIRLEPLTAAGSFIPHTQIGEVIKQQWKKIGVDAHCSATSRRSRYSCAQYHQHGARHGRVTQFR